MHGTFLCNWNLTVKTHEENQLLVAVIENEPVAYIWQDFGILEVREDFRKRGIGTKLVEFALSRALDEGRFAVSIECQPQTSIPFWKKMGFEFHTETEASLILQKKFQVLSAGQSVHVKIEFYPEAAKWNNSLLPVKSLKLVGARDEEGVINLESRVCAFYSRPQYDGDTMIKIVIDGEEVYFDKAKYERAKKIGVNYNSGAYCIEQVRA